MPNESKDKDKDEDTGDIPANPDPDSGHADGEHRIPTSFRPKSTFCPPRYRNAFLETYCRLVERDVTKIMDKRREYKVFNNLPKAQRDALKELQSDPLVVVKPADKGGSICILNRSDYVNDIYRYAQLDNTVYYKSWQKTPPQSLRKI